MATDNYRTYFDLNDAYFPQINETTIAKAKWENTYPHETFIKLLESVHSMLDGRTKRSVWIHGSYGTGKSQCAFALKKILEVSIEELQAYWTHPDAPAWPLNKKSDLLTKFTGHKQRKIVTAYRYGSGGISSTGQLLLAVQESVKKALEVQGVTYTGENTLKEAVISWIEKPAQNTFFNQLLESDKYNHWPQSNADEVLADLRKDGDISQLMNNIFELAVAEGITALNLTTEGLVAWIKDIITQNDIKIVLVWDEFSAYFKNNRNSLDQFQKLAELCEDRFYFIIVTHETSGLINANDKTWEVVKQRFDFSEITLPDGIAFELISHARKVKPVALTRWKTLAETINSWLPYSRKAVMEVTKVTNPDVIKGLLPLHPMGALALKYIAEAFQSNQRSIFNFMSQEIEGVQTFQWFVATTSPECDDPLLTIDKLWNYFYDHHKDELTVDVRSIMDTCARQQGLSVKEQTVLKAVLIMQAINHRLGDALELFRVTDKNLGLAFEGNRDLEGNAAINIAKKLVNDGVLYKRSIGGGIEVYAAAQLVSNISKINSMKDDIRKKINTANLVVEGGLSDVLSLTPALKLRYELESDPDKGKVTTATAPDFTSTINKLAQRIGGWKFQAILCFALDDAESAAFRRTIEAAAQNPQYKDIVIIDALSTPLGGESLEEYIDFSANALYYSSNDGQLSRQNSEKAKRVLDDNWKKRVANGSYIVYSRSNPNGERVSNLQGVLSIMETIVKARFPDTFDFNKGLSGTMLRATQLAASAKCGVVEVSSGAVKDIEKYALPHNVWKVSDYWKAQSSLNISKIKIALEKKIADSFAASGQISISELYTMLEYDYGFAPCNLSAFLAGFLLKEYACEPFRYYDAINGHDSMSSDKLKEMLGNYISNPKSKETYIVKMTEDEMAFYALTEKAWDITPNSCGTAGQAASAVKSKMSRFGLPVWCLSEVDDAGVYDIVEKYIELVQKEGKEAHQKAIDIGKIAKNKSTLADNLVALIRKENFQKGMRVFLTRFEGGKIIDLARAIGAEMSLLSDIERLFAVDYSCLWNKNTGENEIKRLLTEYGFVRESNSILATHSNSLSRGYSDWREKLKFVSVSAEQLKGKLPNLAKVFDYLLKISKQDNLSFDQLKLFHTALMENKDALEAFFNDEKRIFAMVYEPYLEGLSEEDIDIIKGNCQTGMFTLPATDCNIRVKGKADEYRQGQIKTQLFSLWQEKTGTRTPKEWSRRYKLPILAMVSSTEYDSARKAFDALNRSTATRTEIEEALEFLQNAEFFGDLNDEDKRQDTFIKRVVGKYAKILTDTVNVQNALDRLSIEPYDWYRHPEVTNRVVKLAQAQYDAGGSDAALREIDSMDDATLKVYLKRLVKGNMTVGLEIIKGSEADE